MKRKLTLLLSLALVGMLCPPAAVFAEGEEETPAAEETAPAAEYDYEVDAQGKANLQHFLLADTFEGDLVIPDEIDGHPVDHIASACFMNAAGIKTATIPASVTDMGESIFMGCTSLERFFVAEGNTYYTVTDDGVLMADNGGFLVAYPAAKPDVEYSIPAGVDEIAPGAFSFAQNLKDIEIPEGVEFIDGWAFAHSNIEKASVSGTVYQLDDYAFAYCEQLREVNLGNGMEKIYHAAFAGDKALTQITLPSTLTMIGQYAFCGTGLTCVTIPDSLEEISFCAFGYDENMTALDDFTIYGEPNTMAQEYCTTRDEENDYENHFTFVAVADASIPYELGGGTLYEEAADAGTDVDSAAEAADGETAEATAAAETTTGGEPTVTGEIGAELSGNKRMQWILGIGGGVLVVLAGILIAVFAKKPKQGAAAKNEEQNDEQDA